MVRARGAPSRSATGRACGCWVHGHLHAATGNVWYSGLGTLSAERTKGSAPSPLRGAFDPTHYAALKVAPTENTIYRFTADPHEGHAATISDPVTVRVQSRVRAKLLDRHLIEGQKLAVKGKVGPEVKGVKVTLQRKLGSRWKNLTASQTGRGGKFTLTTKASNPGTWKLRVKVATTSTNVGTKTGSARVRVDRYVPPKPKQGPPSPPVDNTPEVTADVETPEPPKVTSTAPTPPDRPTPTGRTVAAKAAMLSAVTAEQIHDIGRRRAWAIWGVALAVYVLAVFHRSSLGVAGLLATERYDINATRLAAFTVLQLVVYAGMQVPVGVLLDRFGSRAMLLYGLVLMTAGQLAFAFSTSFGGAVLARAVLGAGDAMIFVSVIRIVSVWFLVRQAPMVTQLTGLTGQLGAIAAAAPLTFLLDRLGWTRAFAAVSSIGVVLLVAVVFLVKDSPYRSDEVVTIKLRALAQSVQDRVGQPRHPAGHVVALHVAVLGDGLRPAVGIPLPGARPRLVGGCGERAADGDDRVGGGERVAARATGRRGCPTTAPGS